MSAVLAEIDLVPPAFHTGPDWDYSRGDIAADFSDSLGFVLDPEQRLVLREMYAATGPGCTYTTMQPRWATMETAAIAPRQNLKTGVAKPSVLCDVVMFGAESVIWSAHRRKTAMRAFNDLAKLIEANEWFSRYVRQLHRSTGSEAIEFMSGARIEFVVRSEAGGRGETNAKWVVDEALYLTAEQRQAMQPTMAAVPNPKILYLSSPGLEESAELRAIRDRGRTGGDPTLSYLEWASLKKCANPKCQHDLGEPGCVADDEAEWYASNPALGRRISIEYLRATRRGMATKPEKFLIEHMGHWPEGGKSGVISVIRWSACGGEDAIVGPVTVVVDLELDRDGQAWIAVCGATAAGVPQVEIADVRRGSSWVGEKVEQMLADHDVLAVGARSRGSVSSLVPELKLLADDAGVPFDKIATGDFSGMCGLLYDKVRDGEVRHRNDPRILPALKDARRHTVAGAWEWERTKVDTDAAPLVAITGAHALFLRYRDDAADYDAAASFY